jgi:hypothetical protein
LENQVVGALDFKHTIETGKISRVDIAVDLVGIRIDSLDIRYFGKGKSHWYYSPSGEPETGYYGISPSPKGKKNAPYVAYNKRKELKEKGLSDDVHRSLRTRRQHPRSFERCSVPRALPGDDRRAGHFRSSASGSQP